jgi:hypothetical protein
MVADLRAELEASLSAGFVASAGLVPNGWTREISWEPRGEKRILVAIVVSS